MKRLFWILAACVFLAAGTASAQRNSTGVYGVGAVNSGTANQVAYYAATGTAVSGDSRLADSGTALSYTGAGGVSLGTNPSTTGIVNLPNAASIYARNAANTGDLQLLSTDASNDVALGGGSVIVGQGFSPVVTFGGTGSTTLNIGQGGTPAIVFANGNGYISQSGSASKLRFGLSGGNDIDVALSSGTLAVTGGPVTLDHAITSYNNIATVANGLASEYAQANLTAQTANILSATLYAVPAAGLYRVSCYAVVTTAATTSSTLPSCLIGWTDANNATAQSFTLTPTNAGNTLTSLQQNSMVVSAASSTNITYSTSGYASSGATAMQYAIHIRVEAL